jgi:hypothetical protein
LLEGPSKLPGIDPTIPALLQRRATALKHLKRWQEAEADCDRALARKPAGRSALHFQLYRLRAECRGEQAKGPGDQDYFRSVLKDTQILQEDLQKLLVEKQDQAELDDVNPWYWSAMAQLALGDKAGYQKTCQEMRRFFAPCREPEVVNRVAWACVIAPNGLDSAEAYQSLYAWASEAMKEMRRKNLRYRNTLAALQYRKATCAADQTPNALPDARKELEDILNMYKLLQNRWVMLPPTSSQRRYMASLSHDQRRQGTVWDQIFLALALAETGDVKDAEKLVTNAEAWRQAVDSNLSLQEELTWTERQSVKQLLAEAKEVIRAKQELKR